MNGSESREPGGPDGPLSVALASPGWPPEATANGIVPYVAAIASGLRSLGHRACVLANSVEGGGLDPEVYDIREQYRPGPARKAIGRLHYLASPGGFNMGRYRRQVEAAVRRAVSERGVQLIEIDESFGLAAELKGRVPVPLVVRLHGPWFLNGVADGAAQDEAFFGRVRLEGRGLAAADLVTAPSADVLERARAYYGLELPGARVVFNPVRPTPPGERWRPEGCDRETILFVGRFDRHKGGDLMLEAFGILAARRPGVRLVFVGPDRGVRRDDRLWTIGDFLGDKLTAEAAGRVTYLGQRPAGDLPGLRRSAAMTVVPSRYDNFPTTVLEAQAFGCPVVAARVGGIPEIVEDGRTGLLCRPEDPADLAAAMERMLDDRDHAAAMGERAARQCEERLHPAALAAEMAEVYRGAIGRHVGGRRR